MFADLSKFQNVNVGVGMNKDKTTLRSADITMVIGTAFMTAAHFITQVGIWMLADHQQDIKIVAQAVEANPAAVNVLALNGIAAILAYMIQPALLLSVYVLMRKGYIKASPTVLLFSGLYIFFAGLINILNDGGALLGLMISKGMI